MPKQESETNTQWLDRLSAEIQALRQEQREAARAVRNESLQQFAQNGIHPSQARRLTEEEQQDLELYKIAQDLEQTGNALGGETQ